MVGSRRRPSVIVLIISLRGSSHNYHYPSSLLWRSTRCDGSGTTARALCASQSRQLGHRRPHTSRPLGHFVRRLRSRRLRNCARRGRNRSGTTHIAVPRRECVRHGREPCARRREHTSLNARLESESVRLTFDYLTIDLPRSLPVATTSLGRLHEL